MNMVQVEFTSTAYRHGVEVVAGNKVIREYLEEKGAVMSARFTIYATQLTPELLNGTFDDLIDKGIVNKDSKIAIYETIKTNGAF